MNEKRKANSRDVFGRNLSYILSCHSGKENLKSIDLTSYDLESGYTPLHVCLKLGYLKRAFTLYKLWKTDFSHYQLTQENVWDQKDREGLTPIDLFRCENELWRLNEIPVALYPEQGLVEHEYSSLVRWQPRFKNKEQKQACPDVHELRELYYLHRGGRESFTFGSNVNMQLGTGDSDDRQKLFKVDEYQLSGGQHEERVRFKSVIMTRYHSILVTTDDRVFTAGNGSRGRLGNGTLNLTNFKHEEAHLDIAKIKEISASDHHVLVVSSTNEVISWGWNCYFQLGYSTSANSGKNLDKSALDNICGPYPKKLGQCPWKKTWSGEIQHIGCSKVHSCLIDDNNYLYSWGLNLGQMGITKNFNNDLNITHAGQRGHVVSLPYGVKLPAYVNNIKQLLCTEFATFILFQDNQLCVMNNYKILRFTLPKAASKQQSPTNQFDVFTPISLSKMNRVIKIKTSNMFGSNMSVLYENGTVGIVQGKNLDESAHAWSKYPNILPICQYWIPFFTWNKCLDFDVGAKGQLVLCTTGGHIYKSESANSMQFHRQRSGKLMSGKCISVTCDSLFSSFATIKDDVDMIPLGFSKNNLYRDFKVLSPLKRRTNSRMVKCIEVNQDRTIEVLFEDFARTTRNEKSSLGMIVDSDSEVIQTQAIEDKLFKRSMKRWLSVKTLDYSEMYSIDTRTKIDVTVSPEFNDKGYDVLFIDHVSKKKIAGCHAALLSVRSPVFLSHLFKDTYVSFKNECGVRMDLTSDFCSSEKATVIEVTSTKLPLEALLYALHYMYTDELVELTTVNSGQQKREMEMAILQFLKILDISLSSFKNDRLPHTLMRLLENLQTPDEVQLLPKPDLAINLANGAVLNSYSFILACRCAYFEPLLSKDWNYKSGTRAIINMKHASLNEFSLILRYIHGCTFHEMFDHCEFNTRIEFIEFTLNVIQLCDQMLLSDLKHYLESTLIDFIDSGTVIPLLINAYRLSCKPLTLECCWYIYNNIEILFSDKNIDIIGANFDNALWGILENFMKDIRTVNSREKFPSWYDDSDLSSKLVRLFGSAKDKFNETFMDPQNKFEPVFDLTGLPKSKFAGSKKHTDRRKSSASNNSRKASVSQEDLTNIRRPSATFSESRRPSNVNINFGLIGKGNDSAIEDDPQDDGIGGFITVTKSKRKPSASQDSSSSSETSPWQSTPVKHSNVVKFEKKTTSVTTSSTTSVSSNNRDTLFPALSSTLQASAPVEKFCSSSNVEPSSAAFASLKKISQKERIKMLVQENKPQNSANQEKKPVWRGTTPKKSANSTTGSTTNKFPSITESLHNTTAKRKPSTVSLTSTGTSTTIPLYLNTVRNIEPTPTRSLRDTMEEERFAKWWAEESAKVQENLKRHQEMERHLVQSDTPSNQKPIKKHSKDKRHYKSKNKSQGVNISTP